MLFRDVVGQALVKERLTAMVSAEKLPHALMLLGPEGNGGLALALATTQMLQCENRQGNDSCGTCASCIKHQKFIHPDVHFTYPVVREEGAKRPPVSADYLKQWRSALLGNPYLTYNDWMQAIEAENRQGNITADECRQIIQQLNLKTYESGYKVQIIWLPEFLGNEGNILLKALEEPPANAVFILVAENGEQILNTILSRVQIVKVNAIEDDDIQLALSQRLKLAEADARRIARIAGGNMNAALNMAAGEENANDKTLRQWLLYCFNYKHKNTGGNTQNFLEWIDQFSKTGRENQKIFLRYGLFFLRECSMIRIHGRSEKLDGEENDFAVKLSSRLNNEQLEELAIIFNNMHYCIERNANPKILFLSNSVKIASLLKGEDVQPL